MYKKDLYGKTIRKKIVFNVIRFVPPLVIEKELVDEMISILEDCIA